MEKFPDLIDTANGANGNRAASPYMSPSGYSNGGASLSDRTGFGAKRENGHPSGLGISWSNNQNGAARGHGRQKSLSDAFRTIRTRNGSFSQNAHEIADALKAPVSPKLIVRAIPSMTWLAPPPMRLHADSL